MLFRADGVLHRAREVADGIVAAESDGVDRDARWPAAGVRAVQDAGLGGPVVPREKGGLGLGLMGLARVSEVLAQACPSTAMCFGMHGVGAALIAAKATPEQTERYLAPICAGEHLTTLAASEPGTGVHFCLPQAELTTTDDGYRVSGTKSVVTSGGHADSYATTVGATRPS